MSRQCIVTGKKQMSGNNVSHANNKTRRLFRPNIQTISLRSEKLNEKFSFKISMHGLRTIEHKGGLDAFLAQARNSKLCTDLLKIKRRLQKA